MIFAGIDWASDHHDLVVVDAAGNKLLEAKAEHTGEGFAALRMEFAKVSKTPGEIHIGIETHESPLPIWLVEAGYNVYPINPRTASKVRDCVSSSGAKDDRRDAWSLAEHVRRCQPRLRRMQPSDPSSLEMRQYVRLREDLLQERTVHKQQLVSHLQMYAPELEKLLPLTAAWPLIFLIQYPTMKRLQAASGWRLRRMLKKHRVAPDRIEAIVALLKKPAIPVPAGLDEPHSLEVHHRVEALEELNTRIKKIDARLAEMLSNHPDINIIDSLPGDGVVTKAGLWSGVQQDAKQCRSADDMAALWGAAPITIRSGKRTTVVMRRCCDQSQRQSLHWYSFMTAQDPSCWAYEYYQAKRKKGTKHFTILRSIGRRWARILWHLFTTKTTYDEAAARPAACPVTA